jgi:hypothetical protein
LNVPLNNAHWDLYLPPDYDYQKFAGSMTHQEEAAAVLQNYSLSEYHAQEMQKRAAKQAAAASFISNARQVLASGKVKGINNFEDNQFNSSSGGLDLETRNALEDVKQNVDRLQANNLLQQNRVYNNGNVVFAQQSAKSEEAAVALQQWSKLAQSQQVAVARVRPLRVNLPTRGLHHGFTQVLQTQVDKPLSIQFTAANIRSGGLLRDMFDGLLLLILLWAVVKFLLALRPAQPEPA